jgi:iron complex transport system substrate-binding protein
MLKHIGMLKAMLLAFVGLMAIGILAGCERSPAADQPPAPTATTITFTDDAGRQITLDEPAQRIVAGSSFAVELLMAIDHAPVLRPDVPERKIHPEAARSIPAFAIQHGTGPDVEAIVAARADLVILHANFAPFAQNISQTLDVPVALFEIRSVDDVLSKLELFGEITGKADQAAEQVAELRTQVKQAIGKTPGGKPRALALFGTPEAFYAYRGPSYLGSMIEALGAENVAADDEALAGIRSVAPLDLEQAIGRDAQVILIVPHGPPQMVMQHLTAHPAWSRMAAVKNGRVHVLDEVLFSSGPGPRAPEALSELKQLLYADAP